MISAFLLYPLAALELGHRAARRLARHLTRPSRRQETR